ALGDEINLFVNVLLRIERARARDFDDVGAPFPFGAEKLNVGALAAQTLPGLHRQVEDGLQTDGAEDRDAFGLHEQVVGRFGTTEFADAGSVDTRWLMPVDLLAEFVHGALFPAAAAIEIGSDPIFREIRNWSLSPFCGVQSATF